MFHLNDIMDFNIYDASIMTLYGGDGTEAAGSDRVIVNVLSISDVRPRFSESVPIGWSGPGEPLKKFTLFPKLPLELRDIIWSYSIPEGRKITFCAEKRTIDTTQIAIIIKREPPSLQVSKNSDFGMTNATHQNRPASDTKNLLRVLISVPTNITSKEGQSMIGSLRSELLHHSIDDEFTSNSVVNSAPVVISSVPSSESSRDYLRIEMSEAPAALALSNVKSILSANLPSVLQVSKESRTRGLKHYTLSLHKQRHGRPIYINYARDEFRLSSCRDLALLCGNNKGISVRPKNMERVICDGERNEPESMLRFLSFDGVMEDFRYILTTRFRNLELVSSKKDEVVNNTRRRPRLGVYGHLVNAELDLTAQWKKDDRKRGLGCKPNKIPVFEYRDL